MSTFLQMQQRIADDLNRTDLTAQIKKAITRAVTFYQKEPFWFKQTSGTFSTIAAQKAYGTVDGIPSDISRIYRIEITVSGSAYEVIEEDINDIQNGNPNSAQGDPATNYAWWQNKIWLKLVPSVVRTVTVYYTKIYTELSADSDTNDWTTTAEDLVEARARWWLYTRVVKSKDDADSAKLEEIEALQGLREMSEGHIAQSNIPPTEF